MAKRARGAENEMKRRKFMRTKFQKIVRLVMFNRMWLSDSEETKILSLNFKRNIASIVHNEQKVGILTIAERSLLRKEHEFRTVEDRKALVTLVSGLSCFKFLPPKLRARLVPVIKFMLLRPGRKLIHQGAYPPIHVYYIISGEVEVLKRYFDKVTNTYVTENCFRYRTGDCFGDTELLENIPRRFTYKALTDVELIVIQEEIYDRILRPFCSKCWEERRIAVKSLDYFNFFTKDQQRTACKFGQIKQFHPLETIYYEDKGSHSFTYFVLSGECIILQCLKMKVKGKGRSKSFELVNIGANDPTNVKRKSLALRMMIQEENIDSYRKNVLQKEIDILEKSLDTKNELNRKQNMERNLRQIENKCELMNKGIVIAEEPIKYSMKSREKEKKSTHKEKTDEEKLHISSTSVDGTSRGSAPESLQIKFDLKSEETISNTEEVNEEEEDKNEEEDGEEESSETASGDSLNKDPSQTFSEKAFHTKNNDKPDVENRFFDVGSLIYGGIFGLGEKYEHRVIMARTTVQCLVLPRFWLFEKLQNPGNMWQKKRLSLSTAIPTRQQLFTNFLKTRKWLKFKENYIQSNLDHNINSNPTKIEDIPIFCRITEPHDE